MNLTHVQLALRECAERFRHAAQEPDGCTRQLLDNDAKKVAGRLLRTIWHAGYLRELPELGELIENWHSVFPEGYIECDQNLFGEFVGGGVEFDSSRAKLGNTIPGIVQQLAPESLSASALLAESVAIEDRQVGKKLSAAHNQQSIRDCAIACDVLIDYLDHVPEQGNLQIYVRPEADLTPMEWRLLRAIVSFKPRKEPYSYIDLFEVDVTAWKGTIDSGKLPTAKSRLHHFRKKLNLQQLPLVAGNQSWNRLPPEKK